MTAIHAEVVDRATRTSRLASPGNSERARRIGHKVLFVTPETSDFVKTGGLGDVSAALPRALARHHDVRVLVPGYREVLARAEGLRIVGHLAGLAAIPGCDIGRFDTPDGIAVYTLICPELYERDGSIYLDGEGRDYSDNGIRFARLSLAAADIACGLGDPDWAADLVHANDWPAALAPAYIAWRQEAVPSLMTIHNLAYQGVFPKSDLGRIGIPESAFQIDGVEFYGQLSFLKAGIFYADHVTTVSRTYAQEITTPEAGCGLDGLLRTREREGRLTGILNGLDETWDPRIDPHLHRNFEPGDWKGKRINADHIRREFGLAVTRGPLFAVISRLVHQKGIDLVMSVADTIVSAGGQIIVTGKGDGELENGLSELARQNPGQIGVRIGFEEAEARNVFAGSDFLLMPSRFEPCGLSQMYAQRFGSLPIAHRVGGLADSIEDGTTGLLFREPSLASFLGGISRAFGIFASKARLNSMRRAAMKLPASWREPASHYESLYGRSVGNRPRRAFASA